MEDAIVIKLADRYCDDVLRELKVSTVRRGRCPYPLGPGILRTPSVDIGIEICRITYCRYYSLNEEDARKDGFTSLRKLQRALTEFYPGISMDYEEELTIVEFSHPILVWRSV